MPNSSDVSLRNNINNITPRRIKNIGHSPFYGARVIHNLKKSICKVYKLRQYIHRRRGDKEREKLNNIIYFDETLMNFESIHKGR